MLIHDKHEGWITTCDCCESGCFECDYQIDLQANASDFDGETVRLKTGEAVYIEAGMFWTLGGDELCEVNIEDIDAVLEAAT